MNRLLPTTRSPRQASASPNAQTEPPEDRLEVPYRAFREPLGRAGPFGIAQNDALRLRSSGDRPARESAGAAASGLDDAA
jgi:hypothetical protein